MLLSDPQASECLWDVPPSSDLSQYSLLHLVDRAWWQRACSERAAPPLDNSSLLLGDTLRPGLQAGVHFVFLTSAVWRRVVQQFGGGPSVPVHVIRGQPDLTPVCVLAEVTHSERPVSGSPHSQMFLLSLQLTLAQAKSFICGETGLEPVFCSLEVEVQETWTQLADEGEILLEAVYPCQLRVIQTVRSDQTQADLSDNSTPRTRSTGASSPAFAGLDEDEKQPEFEVRLPRPFLPPRGDKALIQARIEAVLFQPRLQLRLKPLAEIAANLERLWTDLQGKEGSK